tara:strand:- start:2466 stop:3584 length:1119 start_codon:yes stop_codon:yes gene_type:complete
MTTYSTLNTDDDQITTRTLLHEAIPLTGTIVSGTYSDNNIKNYAHGMFQSVYDYPYLSSSANHIFDITMGLSSDSPLSSSSNVQQAKKSNIYSQMAQVLMGYDADGNILKFDEDGNITGGGTKLHDVYFLNFARLLSKDEIKKGTFELELGVAADYTGDGKTHVQRIKLTDFSGSDGFFVNSPAGEYGVLFATASAGSTGANIMPNNAHRPAAGLVFYQAGVAVVTASVFTDVADGGLLANGLGSSNMVGPVSSVAADETVKAVLTGSNISGACDNFRNRLYNVQFNNTIELNSTIYFCRVKNNEYNYSSNPTYLSQSQLRVKTTETDMPVSYITTVGLYNSNNELLAVSKLSEPLKKTPDTEFTIRVRLDY